MSAAATKIITGATLILPNGKQSEGSVLIEGNRIQAIMPDAPGSLLLNRADVELISGEGCYLTPGLIELHFNGALGCNLGQTTISDVQNLLQKLPAYGITSVLFTIITAPLTEMLSAIHTLDEAIHHKVFRACRPLGLHLEGPFINAKYRGTHPPQDIRPPSLEEMQLLLSPNLKMVTLAPELDPEGTLIRHLVKQGIQVSLGHTNATLTEMQQAVKAGANSVTHLYNAMRPFHHREPGPIGATLCDDRLYAQIIGDGVHVHPESIRLALRAKKLHQILLTSDASPTAGLPEGTQVQFGHQTVTVKKNQALNQEGHLAGSTALVTDCVRNLTNWNLMGFADAIQLATLNPATFLKEDSLGRLETGSMADLVLWNKETLAVEATFIHGQEIYKREPLPAVTG